MIDIAINAESRRAQDLADALRKGAISLERWRTEMRDLIKTVNVYSAVAARGGWAQMTSEDYGRAGRKIRTEYGFLEQFAEKLSTGRMPLDGHVALFAKQYVGAARGTFHETERETLRASGFHFERNILHPADHCPGCVSNWSRGWVELGGLDPIGSRDCRRNCRCTIAYAKEIPNEE